MVLLFRSRNRRAPFLSVRARFAFFSFEGGGVVVVTVIAKCFVVSSRLVFFN